MKPVASCALFLLAAMAWSPRVRAQDAFEIQVYDPGIDEPGHAGLELHLNYVAVGETHAEAPEQPSDRFFHATLEPSVGITRNFELGGYLQGASGPGSPFEFAGAKLRAKIRFPISDAVDIALNGEISYVPARFEPNVWGSELRPILEYRFARRWLIDFNPIFDIDIGGRLAGLPQFEPCIALRYHLTDAWLLSLEYYAAIGPVTRVLPWSAEYQAAFATADVTIGSGFAIHFGVGPGLTAATNPFVIKSILSKDF